MKTEEQIARNYLIKAGFKNVIFEPNGNIPPDFSIDDLIGAEVRRLNQNYFGEEEPNGLEELSIPLWKHLKNDFTKFDNQFDGKSFWVFAKFKRPSTETRKETSVSVKKSLQEFLLRESPTPDEFIVNDYLSLSVYPATPIPGRVFRLSGGVDRDSGGWLMSVYADNISYCINEKSKKIKPYENQYKNWWLILIDFMGWGFDSNEVLELTKLIHNLGKFNRVILISGENGKLLIDLNNAA